MEKELKVCGDCLGGNIGKKFHDSDWNMIAKKRHKPRGIDTCLDCGSDDVVSIKELLDRAREEVLLELLEKKTNYKIEEVGHGYKVTQEYVLVSDIEKELSKLSNK